MEDLDPDAAHVMHPLAADADGRGAPATLSPVHRIAWVRISDLISSGTGRLAGRGIDFQAELARRLRHPLEVTRTTRDRISALPPLSAFGLRQPEAGRESISRR